MTRYVPNARVGPLSSVFVVWRAKVETRNTALHVITGIVHLSMQYYVISYSVVTSRHLKVKGGRELFAHRLPADQAGARLLVTTFQTPNRL